MRISNPEHKTWKIAILFRGCDFYIPAIYIDMGFYGVVTRMHP
jgi:hypothetical protein